MEIEEGEENKKTITGDFSQEFRMGRTEVSTFLRKLADEIEQGNEININTEEWELPFQFQDNIEVEIEVEKDELEIEIEFEKKVDQGNLDVE